MKTDLCNWFTARNAITNYGYDGNQWHDKTSPTRKSIPNQLLGVQGLATRQVRPHIYSSERLNTRATHIPCCPGQPRENFLFFKRRTKADWGHENLTQGIPHSRRRVGQAQAMADEGEGILQIG